MWVKSISSWPCAMVGNFGFRGEARFKRTIPFWFFLGQCQKEQWKINLKQVADFFSNL
jgi:hypothetical protein